MNDTHPSPAPALAAVGVVVADMRASTAFYALLGLEFSDPAGSGQHLEAVTAGGVRLMLDTEELVASFDERWRGGGAGRVRLAFDCGDAADVDRTHRRAVDAGHRSHLEPFDAFWGQRYAGLLDPDGTTVDLYAESPS